MNTQEAMAKKLVALINLVPEGPSTWTFLDDEMNDLFVNWCGACGRKYGNRSFINALIAAGCSPDVAESGVLG